MRTVDVLTAAQNLFSNKANWTSGALAGINDDGEPCFCALGGVMNAGGCYDWNGSRAVLKRDLAVSSVAGLVGLWTRTGFRQVDYASRADLARFQARGIHAAATRNAIRYLGASVRRLSGNDNVSIVVANDSSGFGYDFIMRAFDLAIKNAKRRHITGDRCKSVQASA